MFFSNYRTSRQTIFVTYLLDVLARHNKECHDILPYLFVCQIVKKSEILTDHDV
jgi:hypothetical protein